MSIFNKIGENGELPANSKGAVVPLALLKYQWDSKGRGRGRGRGRRTLSPSPSPKPPAQRRGEGYEEEAEAHGAGLLLHSRGYKERLQKP